MHQANDPSRLFRHGDELAYLGIAPEEAEKPDRDRRPAILHVDEAVMHGMLIRHLDWVRATESGSRPTKPPVDVARDMVNFRPLPDWLPPLESIITAPSYGPDLKLILPGYNPSLRLAYLPSIVISPPENPSDNDMKEAVGKIGHLLTDFPFKDQSDRANAIGLLLLSLLRPAIPESVPLIVITATLQRAGKGALASIFEILMTGTNASAVQYSKQEEEFRKALLPYISRGQPAIRLDNVDDGSELSSPHLASAVTEGWYCDRVLQRSEVLGVPVRAVFLATGNNITVSKDLLFRTLWIRLTPDTDEPDKRRFVIDGIEQHVRESRAEYLMALAMMVEYWKAKGANLWKARRWNAFNLFVWTIGGVLEACGIRGFLGNTDDQRAAGSPGEEEWRHVLQQWSEATDTPQPASWLLENVFDKCEPLTYVRINGKDEKGRARSLSRLLGRQVGTPRTLAGGALVSIEKTYASKDKRDLFALHVLHDGRVNQTSEALSPHLTRPVSPCGIRPGGYSGLSGLNFDTTREEKADQEDHDTRDSINSRDAELYPLYPPSPPALTGQQLTGRVNGGYTGMTASLSPPEPSNLPDGSRPSPSLPASVKDWPEDWRFLFEERAAIVEYDGNLPREKAEALAEAAVRREFEDYAKN